MNYSTMAFIGTLKPRKHGFITYFVEPVSNGTYGWMCHIGLIAILKIQGWQGERITVVKIGQKEWHW